METSAAINSTFQSLKKRVITAVHTNADDRQAIQLDLINLKKQSRLVHEEAAISKENVAALSKAVDTAHLALESVRYEKKHLERELEQCLATPIFDSVEFSSQKDVDMTLERRAQMEWKLQRIKEEVETRKGMAREVEALQSELGKVFADVTDLKDLLTGIPGKIDEIEKATQALEKFVGIPSISERRARREAVRKAPKPLISLFQTFERLEEEDPRIAGTFTLRVKEETPFAVILDFSGQTESIEFTFNPEWNIVLVEPQIAQDVLVNLLDDGDLGETVPPNFKAAGDPPTFKSTFKRPYKWAQILAGIDLPPESVSPTMAKLSEIEFVERILDKLNLRTKS